MVVSADNIEKSLFLSFLSQHNNVFQFRLLFKNIKLFDFTKIKHVYSPSI